MKLRITILTGFLGILLATGCAPTGLESSPVDPTALPVTPVDADNGDSAPVDNGDDDSMEPPTLSSGEVPQAMFDAVLADLLDRTGGEIADVEVIKAESVTWSDGSLGCPQPGMMYTMALVEGYQIIFSLDGETYDYHLSSSGQFILCTNSQSGPMLEQTK